MGKRGRQRKLYPCPLCLSPDGPVRDHGGPYYECSNCGARLVMDNHQLRETRGYQRQTGKVEKTKWEFYRMSADEYEGLVG